MCGIAGFINSDARPADRRLLEAMTSILAHRGPDGQGGWTDGPVALGHRRLSIIDLATGAQPMSNEAGTCWITYNGELYNFRELRADLEAKGFLFRTSSDTEVLLKAYEAHGVACLPRLRGMFAFAIWDRRHRRLLLARDRVGIKPLVYSWDGLRFRFASELKAILQDASVPRDLDWEALRDYLAYSYVPTPRTIFRHIRKLPPGSYLVLEPGREPHIHRYWNLHFQPATGRSPQDWTEELRWHLRDAVQSHLLSDVPLGAFLSGGIDSSSVVALMAEVNTAPVRTFSIGFDEADFNELSYARLVATQHHTQHQEFVVKANAMDAWSRLAWQFDEPFGDSSALPTYWVSKITRDHVTVALSGDGGDENFAGYRRYARALALHTRVDHGVGRLAKPFLAWLARLLPHGVRGRAYLDLLTLDPIDRYFRMMTVYRTETLRQFLSPDLRGLVPDIDPDPFRLLARAANAPDYVSTLQYLDVNTYLPEDILVKIDRTSMLVSLETRVPLLDHVLMEFVATIPAAAKLQDGRGKRILKDAMANKLPPQVIHREKMGFGVPLTSWFRGDLAGYVRDLLLSQRTRDRGLLNPTAVSRLVEAHERGERDHSAHLWLLHCLEAWARNWVDR